MGHLECPETFLVFTAWDLGVGVMGCHWHLVGGGRDAAQCPTMHRTARTTKKYLTPNDSVLRSPRLSPFSWRERPRMSPELEKGRGEQEKRGSLSRAPSSLPGRLMILRAYPQVDGILEDWVWEMVAALKSHLAQPVNVGLAEWVTLAHNHYTTAVRNTRLVGQEIAALLQWLQVRPALTSLLFPLVPSPPFLQD